MEQRKVSPREVLKLCRRGTGTGALVAVWLRRPLALATGQGVEQSSATGGEVSTACAEHSGIKGALPLCARGLGQLGS